MEKSYYLYVLYKTETNKPVYIGLSCQLRNRIYKHEKDKDFDGVLIVESFKDKDKGLSAERCLIKFFSLFPSENIVNGLYMNLHYSSQFGHINQIKSIKNGRLD